ncbi:GHKL domain-containing protein [Aminipila luticellarii]|uniref:GHKL domain-containing protein n=2 Tax=Aminipila luticellarii TaxID=2507160 RepID=A0A410PT85_9FIRM|nr:GHKL domain-containing protein [Aminipila luticellarii]
MSFTQDIFGSAIEFLNTVILMSLFSPDYFKNKFKLIVSMLIISIIVGLIDLTELPFTSLLIYLIIFITLKVAVKRDIFNILFEFIFATAMIILIEHVLLIVFYRIEGMESLEFINRCAQLLITSIICSIIGLNYKLRLKIRLFYEEYQEEFYLISVTLFCFSMIEMFFWKSDNEVVFSESTIISAYTTIWFLFCLYLLRKLIENKKQKENIRLHEQYMETTENLLNGLYSDKHDFNKHLQAIQSLCQFEEPSKAVREIELYIEELKTKEQNKRKSSVSANTGNGVVNALLYSKTREAEKRQIQLYYVPSGVFPDFPCEQYELVQILGNLLDNAFEYVEGLEREQRSVMLSISEWENKKKIEVRNTYQRKKGKEISISQDKNYSTKSGERRGYGLQNVRAVTQKYHGKFNIFQEDNEFIVEVLF